LSERSNCGQPKRGNAAKGGDRGYDAAKRTKGRKRHIVVDVLGLILAVAVTGANVQDRDGGQLVLKGLKDRFPRLARVWADGVYVEGSRPTMINSVVSTVNPAQNVCYLRENDSMLRAYLLISAITYPMLAQVRPDR
jgi:hypothetical protein